MSGQAELKHPNHLHVAMVLTRAMARKRRARKFNLRTHVVMLVKGDCRSPWFAFGLLGCSSRCQGHHSCKKCSSSQVHYEEGRKYWEDWKADTRFCFPLCGVSVTFFHRNQLFLPQPILFTILEKHGERVMYTTPKMKVEISACFYILLPPFIKELKKINTTIE